MQHRRPSEMRYESEVSVSTSGSKGVQRLVLYSPTGNNFVSVSTSGSKGVQPVEVFTACTFDKRFSIHKRIEGGATGGGGSCDEPPK